MAPPPNAYPIDPPDSETANLATVLNGLIQPFSLIIVSEIGDKTFLIAAILAMRHPRLTVFLGAFSSLLLMSVLSAEMGHFLPKLIPKRYTQLAAAVLFLVFGTKMWVEARGMKGGSEKIEEEMKEAEEEIEGDDSDAEGDDDVSGDLESGIPLKKLEGSDEGQEPSLNGLADTEAPSLRPPPPHVPTRASSRQGSKKSKTSWTEGARNFCSFILGPVFVQAFVLTFLGEWGDRSQFATIMLGAAHNVYIVALGTIIGHSCCTALAVIGGRYVSTKISVKHVTYFGSILFLLFGLIYVYEALSMVPELEVQDIIQIPISADDQTV